MPQTRLRYENSGPPGGVWSYFDPDLNQLVESYRMVDDLVLDVNRLRVTNGHPALPVEELTEKVYAYICDRAPPGFCRGVNPTKHRRALSVASISNFTRALAAIVWGQATGKEVYNPNPAKAAEVCSKCPLNRREYCSSCTGLESVARLLLRQNQTTPLDRTLGACEACGCMLRVKVHYHPDVLRSVVKKADEPLYPQDACWIYNPQLLSETPNA